jgi:hypothetical protein
MLWPWWWLWSLLVLFLGMRHPRWAGPGSIRRAGLALATVALSVFPSVADRG